LLAERRSGDKQGKRQGTCLKHSHFGEPQSHADMSKRTGAVAATVISLHDGQKQESDYETCIIKVGA
jgi:hypothetical protein